VRATADLTVQGRITGSVWADGLAFTIAESATIVGDVFARDITIFGRVEGSLVASEVVDLREGASVTGRILSERLILNDGATFNGRVEPQHLAAALKVARHRRGIAASAPPTAKQITATA
jgi:cytoskeletal protein CcmA (bactofilin family)